MTSEIKLSWFEANKKKPLKINKFEKIYRNRKTKITNMLEVAKIFNIELSDEALYSIFQKSYFYELQEAKLRSYQRYMKSGNETDWKNFQYYFNKTKEDIIKQIESKIYYYRNYKYTF